MLLNGAANRDPRRSSAPHEFHIDRPTPNRTSRRPRCPTCPAVRWPAEGRVSIERIVELLRDIRLSEKHHVRPGLAASSTTQRWVLRGLTKVTSSSRQRGRPMAVRGRHRWRVGHRSRRRPRARHRRHHVAVLDRNARQPTPRQSSARRRRDAIAVEVDVADRARWTAHSRDPWRAGARRDPCHQRRHRVVRCTPRHHTWHMGPDPRVNLTGTSPASRLRCPTCSRSLGRIVTIASSSAQSAHPTWRTTRHRRAASSRSPGLAVELARSGITANAITPSLVDTRWRGRLKRRVTSQASTSSGRWSRSAGPARLRHRARVRVLCADGAATSPARVIGVKAACTSDRAALSPLRTARRRTEYLVRAEKVHPRNGESGTGGDIWQGEPLQFAARSGP